MQMHVLFDVICRLEHVQPSLNRQIQFYILQPIYDPVTQFVDHGTRAEQISTQDTLSNKQCVLGLGVEGVSCGPVSTHQPHVCMAEVSMKCV